MATTVSAAIRNTWATSLLTAINAGAGPGKLRLFDGAVLCAELTLSDPAGTVTGPTLTVTVPKTTLAVADGTVDNFTLVDSDNTTVLSGDAGLSGTNTLILDNTSITNGQTINLTQYTYTVSEG